MCQSLFCRADFKDIKIEMKKGVIISGIGTGGHYFPAVVVAQELKYRGVDVFFLVRPKFSEDDIATKYDLGRFYIPARPFRGKPIAYKFISVVTLIYSVYKLLPLFKENFGFSFGGFGSLPLILACMIKRRPFFLFEPNCLPGWVTRFFSGYAKKVFLGLPSKVSLRGNTILCGIPLRPEFRSSYIKEKDDGLIRILFIGGSQGARRLNELAISIAKIIPENYRIVIISGRRDFKWVDEQKDHRTKVIPFTERPWEEIKKADIVISRAGALAGYELLALKKRVIFIPFPYATDNHQYYNARVFSEIGAGIVLEEKGLTPEFLKEKLEELYSLTAGKNGSCLIMDAEKRIGDIVLKELE